MTALVTGATGFIGRFLVQELVQRGDRVICLVRNPKKVKMLEPLGVEFLYADVTEPGTLDKVREHKIDVVFHCAGYVKNDNPRKLHEVNVLGTKNICQLALELGVERLVYTSSVSVINGHQAVPLTDDLSYKASNIYGESKIEAEKETLNFRKKGLKVVIIRPSMVYGESEPHLLNLLLTLLRYRILPLLGGGKTKLHLVYVRNVTQAMISSLDNDGFLEGTFLSADNEILSAGEVYTILSKAINVYPPWQLPGFVESVFLNMRFRGRKVKTFLRDRVYSIERLKSVGFIPPYPAEESLARSARYWLKYRKKDFSFDYLEK